jgi:hypothetical protein
MAPGISWMAACPWIIQIYYYFNWLCFSSLVWRLVVRPYWHPADEPFMAFTLSTGCLTFDGMIFAQLMRVLSAFYVHRNPGNDD